MSNTTGEKTVQQPRIDCVLTLPTVSNGQITVEGTLTPVMGVHDDNELTLRVNHDSKTPGTPDTGTLVYWIIQVYVGALEGTTAIDPMDQGLGAGLLVVKSDTEGYPEADEDYVEIYKDSYDDSMPEGR